MTITKIFIGGWFQRTTLHLTEIYDFLSSGKSDLQLDTGKLTEFRQNLNIDVVSRHNWFLEYISASTKSKIDLRIYEDGLMVLEKTPETNLLGELNYLDDYYDHLLSPAISYIFSRGAPVPKELAQIKTLLPYIFLTSKASAEEINELFISLGQMTYASIQASGTEVYKSPKAILIVTKMPPEKARLLVEEQIFFREFKSQLHRYLNIHRLIWDEIAMIKERGQIPGSLIRELRGKLDGYQKTIELIDSRINQMSSYLHTRAKISSQERLEESLNTMFSFKFETLEDTLSYIKELWKMTNNYLSSAIRMFTEMQTETTKTSISSLQLITALGVVAAIVGYLGKDKLPYVTPQGVIFFAVLISLTWGLNFIVSRFYSNRTYLLKKDNHHLSLGKVKAEE